MDGWTDGRTDGRTTDGRTDGRTDRQTDGGHCNISRPRAYGAAGDKKAMGLDRSADF